VTSHFSDDKLGKPYNLTLRQTEQHESPQHGTPTRHCSRTWHSYGIPDTLHLYVPPPNLHYFHALLYLLTPISLLNLTIPFSLERWNKTKQQSTVLIKVMFSSTNTQISQDSD